MKMVKYKKKLWKIKTRKDHSEYGHDYQDGDVETKEGTFHGWISSPQEGIFRLDQMDGD